MQIQVIIISIINWKMIEEKNLIMNDKQSVDKFRKSDEISALIFIVIGWII